MKKFEKNKNIVSNETRISFEGWQLKRLPIIFNEIIKKNPKFEGSKLVFTGNYGKNQWGKKLYEFALLSNSKIYTPIPGYEFVGYTEHVEGEHWTVYRISPQFEFSSDFVLKLDPLRCDVCGHKRARKRLFVCCEVASGKIVVVGGSCAKKFHEVNLENLLWEIKNSTSEIAGELEERYGRESEISSLAFDIALAEAVIKKIGYVSKGKSEESSLVSTSSYVSAFHSTGCNCEKATVEGIARENSFQISRRASELMDTDFGELKDHFNQLQEKKWTEFGNNMLAYLAGKKASDGVAAYLGSITSVKIQKKDKTKVTKGFSASLDKMMDLGEFEVISTKIRENQWGLSLGFTCVSHDGGKLWFQISSGSGPYLDWRDKTNDDSDVSWKIKIRGKVTKIESEISFAKNVKFLDIFRGEQN